MGTAALAAALVAVRDAVGAVRLPLDLPGSAEASATARAMATQLDDYILPRLERLEAPLLAVVGGSTGAGKSTLVNSLIGRVVSRPGVIRPTTRSPVLVHHPDDAEHFQSDRVLPGLGRTFDASDDTSTLQLVAEPSLPRGLALLDAPDIDSVVAENRALAAQLLAAADLWLFVTSAARYADAVPWEYLRSAAERGAAVAVVLDRIPLAAMSEVPAHLGRLMTERGLGGSPLFAVPETTTDDAGLLPDSAVAPIRGWLAALASDQASRQAVVLQTLDGAIGSLVARAPAVATAFDDQVEALTQLRTDAEKAYAEAVRTVGVQTADGTLLRGEVLARWQDFVGTGAFMRAVEERIGRIRDRVVAAFKGEPPQAAEVKLAVESGLEVLICEEGDAAAERAEASWAANAAGRQILERARADLAHSATDFSEEVRRAVRLWQSDVLDLVREVGASKRSTARYLALGVNGVGVALMVVVFSQTGGLTGAEVGVAGGTAVLAQRLLEAVFGEDAVRRLARQAKELLDEHVQGLMAAELYRYLRALVTVGLDATGADAVRAAVDGLARRRGEAGIAPVEAAELGSPRPALGAPETPALSGDVLDPIADAYRVEVPREA